MDLETNSKGFYNSLFQGKELIQIKKATINVATTLHNIAQNHQISPHSAYMSAARLSSGPWSTLATRHMTPEQVHE